MKRTHKPRGLKILSVALALLLGVFLLSPVVAAEETGSTNDEDGLYIGGHAGGGGKGQGSGGGQGGDDTDPDWWTMSVWQRIQESENAETPAVRSTRVVVRPFGGLLSWLLKETGRQYLSLWK